MQQKASWGERGEQIIFTGFLEQDNKFALKFDKEVRSNDRTVRCQVPLRCEDDQVKMLGSCVDQLLEQRKSKMFLRPVAQESQDSCDLAKTKDFVWSREWFLMLTKELLGKFEVWITTRKE